MIHYMDSALFHLPLPALRIPHFRHISSSIGGYSLFQSGSAQIPTATRSLIPDREETHGTFQQIRSGAGPGRNFPVVSQIGQGISLCVQGTAPGWYYVLLPEGQSGWVMCLFTQSLAAG